MTHQGNTDANLNPIIRTATIQLEFIDAAANALANIDSSVDIGLCQTTNKLVSTIAIDEVGVAHHLTDYLRHIAQHLIAGY